jgi:hypothetical protein
VAEKKTISILDMDFDVSMPYEAGHTLTEAEAKVLNQTRRENLGNNMRAKVKAHLDGAEGALTAEQLQELFAKNDAEYVFTMANASAAVKYTPEEKEARKIARDYIRQQLAAQVPPVKIGEKPEGFEGTDDDWDNAIEAEIDRISQEPQVVKIAKDTVKARSKVTTLQLSVLGSNSGAEAEPTVEA